MRTKDMVANKKLKPLRHEVLYVVSGRFPRMTPLFAFVSLVSALALCTPAAGITGGALRSGRRLTGNSTFYTTGRIHTLTFDVTHASAAVDNMISLDLLPNLTSTVCNIDPTSMQLHFDSYDSAADFYDLLGDIRLLSDAGDVFLSTSSSAQRRVNGTTSNVTGGCPASRSGPSSSSAASSSGPRGVEFMMRKLLGDPEGVPARRRYTDTCNPSGCIVTLRTAPVNYEGVYQNATLSYSSKPTTASSLAKPADRPAGDTSGVGGPPAPAGWEFCVGLNADPESCAAARGPIDLYSSAVLDVSCDNCFVGVHGEVFFDLEIGLFLLRRLSAGFRAMAVDSGLGIDATAQVDRPILAVDKQLFQAGGQDAPVLAFRIGPVPFLLWFEGSIGVTGDLTFAAQAEARAGLHATYAIGDNYIQWAAGSGWTHVTPSPQLTVTPSVSGSASFDVTGSLALPAQLSLHANQIFTHTLRLQPQAQLHVHGDTTTKQICVDGSLSASLVASGELHMNILWHLIDVDASFGPDTLWSATRTLPTYCVGANASEA